MSMWAKSLIGVIGVTIILVALAKWACWLEDQPRVRFIRAFGVFPEDPSAQEMITRVLGEFQATAERFGFPK